MARGILVVLTLVLGLAAVSSRPHAQPPAPNNLLYEIFVRAFADGDNDPKGIGDLKGIAARLDSHLQ